MFAPSSRLKLLYYALAFAIAVSGIAWAGSGQGGSTHLKNFSDTVPPKISEKSDKGFSEDGSSDIDQRIEQLDKAMQKLDKQLQGKYLEKMQQHLEESLSQVDLSKIQQQMTETMKKLDLEKVRVEAETAMKQVDWDKIQQEIKTAMDKAKDNKQLKEMQHELEKATKEARKNIEASKKINFEEIKDKLDEARLQLEKESQQMQKALNDAKEEMSNNKNNLKQQLEQAKTGIARAREELISYKTMISLMEKDRLIKSDGDYSIKYQSGELIINGKKQPREVTDKYKAYFSDDVEIARRDGKFSLKKGDEK